MTSILSLRRLNTAAARCCSKVTFILLIALASVFCLQAAIDMARATLTARALCSGKVIKRFDELFNLCGIRQLDPEFELSGADSDRRPWAPCATQKGPFSVVLCVRDCLSVLLDA